MNTLTPENLTMHLEGAGPDDLLCLEVTSPHCAPCKAVQQLLEKEAAGLLSGWHLYQIDAGRWPDWAALEGIRTTPVLRLYRGRELVLSEAGLITRSDLEHLIRVVQKGRGTIATDIRRYVDNKDWRGAEVFIKTLTDEQSRLPEVQRVTGLLNSHNLDVPADLSETRDRFISAALVGNNNVAQEQFDGLLQLWPRYPQVRELLITLIDVYPDRSLAQVWRRQLHSR